MPRQVEPKVFLIAETQVSATNLLKMLQELGVSDWDTDAESNAEMLIEVAGKSCYMSFSKDLNKNLTKVGGRNNFDYIQQGIIATGHGSVLEHASMTLFFMNVSRVFTHELVRHRPGMAYSQVSGRYVRTDEISYWVPPALQGTPAEAMVYETMHSLEQVHKRFCEAFQIDQLTDMKRKKQLTSAFRRILPNGQSNHVVATANHRALRHIIEMRTDRSAEEEMRYVFAKVFELVRYEYISLYADAKVEDVDGIPEIKFTGRT